MTEKLNTGSHGKGRQGFASVLLILIMISLMVSVIVTTQGCEQVSSDTVTQCYACIQSLQEAISSALRAAENNKTQTMSLQSNGKTSPSALSISDLNTLQTTLDLVMSNLKQLSISPISLEKNTMIFSSRSPTKAEDSLLKQYNGGYMEGHYSGEGN